MKLNTKKALVVAQTHEGAPAARITPELQSVVSAMEQKLAPTFSRRAAPLFQDLVAETGGTLEHVDMPSRRVPYWLKGPNPLANFQSRPKLPKQADIVIIGASA